MMDEVKVLTEMAIEANNHCRAGLESLDPTSAVAYGMGSLSSGVLALLMLEQERQAERAEDKAFRERARDVVEKIAAKLLDPTEQSPPEGIVTELASPVNDLLMSVAAALPLLTTTGPFPEFSRIVEDFKRCQQPT
jgi:hypothetical protein